MRGNKTVAVAGAAVGIALFLSTALLPAVLYGGYAGLLLATGIFGAPVPQHLFARGLIAFGSLLGVFATGAVFAVLGAASASGLAHLFAMLSHSTRENVAHAHGNPR
jgi:hypothetical protein